MFRERWTMRFKASCKALFQTELYQLDFEAVNPGIETSKIQRLFHNSIYTKRWRIKEVWEVLQNQKKFGATETDES